MQTELLKVTDTTCGGCTSSVTHALKAVSGVSNAKVSLSAGEATVQYDQRLISPEQLKSAVQRASYGVDAANPVRSQQGRGSCCG